MRETQVSEKRDKTLGQISSELSFKDPGNHTAAEQGKEQLKDYLPNLIQAVERGKKEMPQKDFYIVVLTKRERLMQNVFRHYFFTRMSCPTPDYDQALYHYESSKDEITFIWVIPDPYTCNYFKEHMFELAPEDKCLLEFIVKFSDGTLDKLARELNGETENQLNPIVRVST